MNEHLRGHIRYQMSELAGHILVYSDALTNHQSHVQEVRRRLGSNAFSPAEKCEFPVTSCEGPQLYAITRRPSNGSKNPNHAGLPNLESLRYPICPRFATSYRRFIPKYSKITLPLNCYSNEGPLPSLRVPFGLHAQKAFTIISPTPWISGHPIISPN